MLDGPMSRVSTTARRYFVRGRVQGVGYRWFVQKTAADLGLTGYVRNLDDGRVEVYAVGSEAALSELAGLLRTGPRWSEVRGVDEQEAAVEKRSSFQIEG
jgi:acylphosphatase